MRIHLSRKLRAEIVECDFITGYPHKSVDEHGASKPVLVLHRDKAPLQFVDLADVDSFTILPMEDANGKA